MIKLCKKCREEKRSYMPGCLCGYLSIKPEYKECPINSCVHHKENESYPFTDTDFPDEDYYILTDISTDIEFIEAMMELRKKDPIEYQYKMSQFRMEVEQREATEQQMSSKAAQPTCPACGSANIQLGTKGFSLVTGFIGSSSPRYYCLECHHKWKPGSVTESITRAWNNK